MEDITLIRSCVNCNKELSSRQKIYCSQSCHFTSLNKQKSKNNWHIDINDRLHQIIEGSLMGDGGLELNKKQINPNFSVNQMGTKLEYLENLTQEFNLSKDIIKFKNKYNKKLDKNYDSWCFRTRAAAEFLPYYQRWYPNNTKIIPKDFKITSLSLYHWYIGDGSLYQNAKELRIVLYTNGFNIEDVEWLQKQFLNFDIKFNLNLTKYKGYDLSYPILKTGARDSVYNFFKLMPENKIFCYQYKFDVIF